MQFRQQLCVLQPWRDSGAERGLANTQQRQDPAAIEETAGAVANGGPVAQQEEDSGSVAAADAGDLTAEARAEQHQATQARRWQPHQSAGMPRAEQALSPRRGY